MKKSKRRSYTLPLLVTTLVALSLGILALVNGNNPTYALFAVALAFDFLFFGMTISQSIKSKQADREEHRLDTQEIIQKQNFLQTQQLAEMIAGVGDKLQQTIGGASNDVISASPSPPKSFDEIKAAIGKSPEEIGDAVLNKIRKGIEALQQGQYSMAEGIHITLIELFPDVSVLHFNLGLAYHLQKKLPESIKEYRIALGNQ